MPREEGWRERPVWSVKTWLAGGGGEVGVDVVGARGGGSRIGRVEVFEFFELGDGGRCRRGRVGGVGGSWRRRNVGGGCSVGVFLFVLFGRLEIGPLLVEVAFSHW